MMLALIYDNGRIVPLRYCCWNDYRGKCVKDSTACQYGNGGELPDKCSYIGQRIDDCSIGRIQSEDTTA